MTMFMCIMCDKVSDITVSVDPDGYHAEFQCPFCGTWDANLWDLLKAGVGVLEGLKHGDSMDSGVFIDLCMKAQN